MPNTDKHLFDFSSANILIIGTTCLDIYWHGDINRVSPEAPVPVTHFKNSDYRLSGAGLIASIISNITEHCNSQIKLLSPISSSIKNIEFNNKIIELLAKYNIDTSSGSLLDLANITASQIRIVGQAQQLLNIENRNIEISDLYSLDKIVRDNISEFNSVIFYDDGSNVINNDYINTWSKICHDNNITSIYIPDHEQALSADANANANANINISNINNLNFDYIISLDISDNLKKLDSNILLLNNKNNSLKFIDKDNLDNFFVDENGSDVEDIIGSTEALTALFSLAVSCGKTNKQGVELANSALSVVHRHFGQEVINKVELQLAYSDYYLNYKFNFLKLKQDIKASRNSGQSIVFANGCFDVLHIGHIAYLEAAKKKGDRLFVAINSDCSIKRLKGETRPINSLEDRISLLSHLQSVDWVVPFFTDTPNDLLRWLQPDILVKGGDYDIDGVVGREIVESYGGKVEVLKHSYINRSSTKIIESSSIDNG